MIIKNTTKLYKEMQAKAISLEPETQLTTKSSGLYYKAEPEGKSIKTGAVINFNSNGKTYRYNFKSKVLQEIPNPYAVETATYMANLNMLFSVYENEATAEKITNAVNESDPNDRNFELLQLSLDPDFKDYCSKSEHTGRLMLAKNFFNHSGLSHGRESSRVNKTGDSNFRGVDDVKKLSNKNELTDWLRSNPSAIAKVGTAGNAKTKIVTDETISEIDQDQIDHEQAELAAMQS